MNWITADTGPVDPMLYVRLPNEASPTDFASRMNATAYKLEGRDYAAAGYRRVPSPQGISGDIVYIKGDCGLTRHGWYDHSCSTVFSVDLMPRGQDGSFAVYQASFAGFSSDTYRALQLKLAQAFPKELFLYIPATKSEPPRVFKAGKYLPIE